MVWHMEKIFNNMKLMGTVGAILGGWIGAYWAITHSVVYHMGAPAPEGCKSLSGFTPDQFAKADSAEPASSFAVRCSPYEVYDWSWLQLAPVMLAAAIVGAFVVLLGLGILRKVYRT
jgi:disulfide bond formation protein DsbB